MRALLSILLVAGILVASAVVALVLHDSAADRIRAAERVHAGQAAQELEKTLEETAFRIRGVAGLFEASERVSRSEYRAFVTPLFGEQDALNAVIWMPRITEDRRRAYESLHRRRIVEGPPDARQTAAERPVYFPVTYLETDARQRALGFDAFSDPTRRRAIRRATQLSASQSTPPVVLAGSGQAGILIYQPVFAAHKVPAASTERERTVQGVVGGSYRVASLLASLRRGIPAGTRLQVQQDGVRVSGSGNLQDGQTAGVTAVGRSWTVRASSNASPSLIVPASVLLTGAALALLVALMLRQSFTRERYALTMVGERMLERDEAQHELEGARLIAQRLAAEQTALRRVATSIAAEEPLASIRETIRTELMQLFDADDAAIVRHLDGRLLSASEPEWFVKGTDPSIVRFEMLVGPSTRGTIALLNPAGRDGIEERLRDFAELASVAVVNAEARQELNVRASTDGLTGLLNRRSFDERLGGEVSRAIRHGRALSLAIIDIDHFKRVNDRHGHLAGDAVLTDVAGQLSALARDGDTVARIGGEEFAWIMPETPSPVAFDVADRVRAAVAATNHGDTTDLTISVGIADLGDALTADGLYRRADTALFHAKGSGRNQTIHQHGPVARVSL